LLRPDAMSPLEVTRFKIQSVTGDHITTSAPLALSPDGRRLVYGVGNQVNIDNSGRFVLHELESGEGRLLEGLPDAGDPFFAPGNDLIGFATTSGALQQLSLLGGTPTPLVNLSSASMGASWGSRGTIVSSGDWGQPLLLTLLENDGNTEVLTTLDSEAREGAHLWPQILPGNRAALFTIWIPAPSVDESLLAVVDLESGKHRLLSERGIFGRYATSGHLIFWRGGALMAAPFDLDTLSVSGDAKVVVEGVRANGGSMAAHYTISDSGALAYVSGELDYFVESSIMDRSGNILLRLDDTVAVSDPSFSPDGRQVALTVHRGGIYDIGVYDLDRETLTFLPTDGDNLRSSWTHDGDRITYLSNADGPYNHYSIDSGGGAEAQPLLAEPHGTCCRNRAAWSPRDQHAVISVTADGGGQADYDLWILSSDSETSFEPLFTERGNQLMPAFSPNGRWIAYESTESNVTQVWLRPFPDVQIGRRKVSVSEGAYPVWNPNGEEILYLTEDGIMSVAILEDSGTLPTLGQEQLILEMTGIKSFDISPDGQTFAVSRFPEESAPREINIVLNWFEELKERVPVP
jgi:serine/threonine-protein kinase